MKQTNFGYYTIIVLQFARLILRRIQLSFSLDHLIDVLNVDAYFLGVVTSLDPSAGEDAFGNASGAQGQYGLLLLHDQDVVDPRLAVFRLAHIFEISGHILLSVEIVGMHAH